MLGCSYMCTDADRHYGMHRSMKRASIVANGLVSDRAVASCQPLYTMLVYMFDMGIEADKCWGRARPP